MKYLVDWSEVKKSGETNGRAWKITSMTLKDEQGVVHEGVTTFDAITTGQTLEGEIETETKGQYTNKKFKNIMKQPSNAIYNKTAQVEKVMERKEVSIGKFQDNKDWSIMTSSTMRDAVLLAIEESKAIPDYNFESGILKWRNWLINNWEVNETDKKPF